MGDPERRLREAMRWLLLPIPVDGEDIAVESAREELERHGVASADAPLWLEVGLAAWRRSGSVDKNLASVVKAYIASPDDALSRRLAAKYFDLHGRLKHQPRFEHDSASALLSHARLINLLARDESLSASQIAKLVAARDRRVPLSWKQVQVILRATKLGPSMTVADVESVYRVDEALEIDIFADADEEVCAEMVASSGAQLGFDGNLRGALQTLLPADRTPFGPYLQILHYQCIIAEYYDHALSSIYEFSPRGKATNWLLHKYPSALEVKGNPYLNNAKGVDQLNDAWARGRKSDEQILQAHALVSIVRGLDDMGYAARRELAAWLRRLLVRRIRLSGQSTLSIPNSLNKKHAKALLRSVSDTPTHTRGIIEQRIVDAVAVLRHPGPQWIARGLGDSVNATNLSGLKCGDCDFQDAGARCVAAYEAHGGKLTEIYLASHLQTLEAILPERAREWEENLGSSKSWKVNVTFVAHDFVLKAPIEREIVGIAVKVDVEHFGDFISSVNVESQPVLSALNAHVRGPLAEPRTPNSIRESLLKLIR